MSTDEGAERIRLGQRIKEAREYLGYSQDEVSGVLGISRPAMSLIESGQRKVDALELKRLATFFEKPSTYFTDEPNPSEKKQDRQLEALARVAGALKPEDVAELQQFAEYLRARAQARREKNG